MQKGIIVGNIVSTRKQTSLVGSKFMEVRLIKNGKPTDEYIVAVDSVGAGIGEQVLVVDGSTARRALGGDDFVVDCAIVGIIDSIEMRREDNPNLHL